jgi:hypothetical protein
MPVHGAPVRIEASAGATRLERHWSALTIARLYKLGVPRLS